MIFNEINILLIILTVIFNLIIFFYLKKFEKIINIYDVADNDRKIHKKSMPLLGGFIIFSNIIFIFILNIIQQKYLNIELPSIILNPINIILATSIFVIGVYDDKADISANFRLLIIAVIVLSFLIIKDEFLITSINTSFIDKSIEFHSFSLIFTSFCIIIFLNAFNMYDGIDLQNGIYSFGLFSYLFYKGIEPLFSILIMIGILNFLILNFNKKLFMGDSGTTLLSIIFSLILISSYNNGQIEHADEILLLMLIPGLEIIRLFITRIVNKKNPFFPDRDHLHHYLIASTSNIRSNAILVINIFFPIILSFIYSIYTCLIIGITLYSLTLYYFKYYKKNKYRANE